jgi:acetylornithine deacetylase/succinyl-diaminopimelate desuccinylase-like protein
MWPMKKSHLFYLILILLLDSTRASAQTTRPEAERKLARDIYKEFVEIPSGFTTGATTPVAEAAAARLRAAGFPESDIFVGGANPKKANLVVRYHGTGALKPILLLAHIDVVEAKREDWSMDPFQLNERATVSFTAAGLATTRPRRLSGSPT